MSTIIALAGSKRVGKDFAYQFACQLYPHLNLKKIAFADPIKEHVMEMFGLRNEEEYDLFKTVDVHTNIHPWMRLQVPGRKIVRDVGMLMRDYDPQQFVQRVESTVTNKPGNYFITDLRFENEIQMLYDLASSGSHMIEIVKIIRPGYGYDGHPSERDWILHNCCTIVIENNGSLDDYKVQLREFFYTLWGPAVQHLEKI